MKYLCIHGHFYQPPRENPWMEAIEPEPSARPYHDWNERIHRECYGPNAWTRLHRPDGRILKFINNYEYMSFNFGPTLLSWMERAFPETYQRILVADKAGQDRNRGHGNALAQVYNHMIMPLASRRDKRTQILWGLTDFRHRFGRDPEGMWLAETAVDTETLTLMAREGLKFTILAPTQARAVRPITGQGQERPWRDVSGKRIDSSRPYRVFLDESRACFMDVFFYDDLLSKGVAFENALGSGSQFLERIQKSFGSNSDQPRLVSIATDGESYGHHFKFGDMALAWLFDHLKKDGDLHLTNYAAFLEAFPPEQEARLIENSAWSCAHGVERWRSDCGCRVGAEPGWHQRWRTPLREGMDWLSLELAFIFEDLGGRLFSDIWATRDDYISVLLNPGAAQRDRFLQKHARKSLSNEEKIQAFQLLESQRMALFMFTSCGWFFDDISGLESTQVMKYAARAVDLVAPWATKGLDARLCQFLTRAESNDPDFGHGGKVYETRVETARIRPSGMVANYALTHLVERGPGEACNFAERIRPIRDHHLLDQDLDAVIGEAQVEEKMTGVLSRHIFLASQRETGDFYCLVGDGEKAVDLQQVAAHILPTFQDRDRGKTKETFSRAVGGCEEYTSEDLLPDTRRCLIQALTDRLDAKVHDLIRNQDELIQSITRLVRRSGEKPRDIFHDLMPLLTRQALLDLMEKASQGQPEAFGGIDRWLDLVEPGAFSLNEAALKTRLEEHLRHRMTLLKNRPVAVDMEALMRLLDTVDALNMAPDLWYIQNLYDDLQKREAFLQSLDAETRHAFRSLGERLGFAIEDGK